MRYIYGVPEKVKKAMKKNPKLTKTDVWYDELYKETHVVPFEPYEWQQPKDTWTGDDFSYTTNVIATAGTWYER